MFEVFKPKFTPTGEITPGQIPVHWNRTELIHLGFARDMEHALEQFPRGIVNGYSPILERINGTKPH